MTSSPPCGACKFLRRKCVKGCVFAPYFCHEQGPAHFAAIHRVFGASNVSKLLAHLPVNGRCEAAITIAYEAQARLQDPIYGCVSHIFALQQQVVSLQSQLAYLKAQAAQSVFNASSCSNHPINDQRHNCRLPSYAPPQDIHNLFQQLENPSINTSHFDQKSSINDIMNIESMGDKEGLEGSFFSFQEGSSYSIDSLNLQVSHNKEWAFQENREDLHSVAFGYIHH
ncbi:hypothetical protein SSX86_011669 [Deinandra increscens subsp. villosa]|uniref:LOB domain-containing protein n=1 Tax=Deinandra increscens subsp. villosa TaxID=3103831 RepID=A0AAP0GY17_9ASTR